MRILFAACASCYRSDKLASTSLTVGQFRQGRSAQLTARTHLRGGNLPTMPTDVAVVDISHADRRGTSIHGHGASAQSAVLRGTVPQTINRTSLAVR